MPMFCLFSCAFKFSFSLKITAIFLQFQQYTFFFVCLFVFAGTCIKWRDPHTLEFWSNLVKQGPNWEEEVEPNNLHF